MCRSGIEPVEVDLAQLRGRTAFGHLAVGDFIGLEMDDITGVDLDCGRVVLVPLVMDLPPLDGVLVDNGHLTLLAIRRLRAG